MIPSARPNRVPRSKYLPLIQTKLHRPAVGRLFVHRPRLNEQLNRGLDGPLSLVCAPAGFGKTTTVSAWIDSLNAGTADGRALPSAWLTLDERDGDLIVFMHYFIAALRTIFPGACAETAEMLTALALPGLDLLTATLSNEIASLPSPFVMVLDDNASADNRAVYVLFGKLLRHWPPPMHLVMISRREPPLPLAGLRAKDMVSEIRTSDLRFTREETAAFLDLSLPSDVDPAILDRLERATEGWITGLRLIIRTSHIPDVSDGGQVIGASSATSVTDYLFDEVLSGQPDPIRAFLLQTAILDRFCTSLAAAVIGRDDPEYNVQECIAWIAQADLFVSAQDDRGEWYRSHPLFQALLLKRLRARFSPEQVNRLHERAAGWFAERGETDEAIHHALAIGNLELAARLMEQGLCDVLNRDDPPALERWLRLLPEELVQHRAGLLMLKAWVLQFSWQLAAQARILDQAEALLASDEGRDPGEVGYDAKIVRGQLATMRAQQAFWSHQPTRAIACCQEAMALLPQSWVYVRGAAVLYEGLARWTGGDGDAIARLLLERYELLEHKTDYVALRHLLALCFVWHQSGQLERLRQTARVMLEQAQRGESAYMRNWAHYFFGVVHYERRELERAGQPLAHLVEHYHTIFMAMLHDGFALMTLVLLARGDVAGAMALSRRLSELDLERLGDETDASRALRARLQLVQGDVEEAGRWADAFTSPLPERPMMWIENPHLTRARILIARNRDADAATALEVLDALYDLAERTHNTPIKIESLALQALALDAMRRPEDGLDALRQALDLCHPGDFVRVFVDLGPHMMAMLRRLATNGFAIETIRRILAAFPRPSSGALGNGHLAGVARSFADVNASLVELLTPRELEILELLHRDLSDKEIASTLFLSPLTVKRHKANIFGKLGVHRRADAVARAEMLGILATR
jgi:LuxR family maltose regulon positive regulatory protein